MAPLRKSVLITGCSEGGIGAGLAEAFQAKGYHVFASVRNPARMPPTLASAANVTPLTLDVLSPASIAAAVDAVGAETGGKLDVLVNNSGGGMVMPALDASIEQGKKLFDLNFWAPVAMLQAFAPLLIQARGCVVNNTSANAVVPMPLFNGVRTPDADRQVQGFYSGSKAALAIASDTWRQELQPLGVRCITVITCAVKTKAFDNYDGPEMPESSLYYPLRDVFDKIRAGQLQDGAISASQYAAKVVGEVEKGTSGTIWAGTGAFANRLAVWLSPMWLMDMILGTLVPLTSEMAKAAKRKTT